MHSSTYQYLQPTEKQIKDMHVMREKASEYQTWLDMLPDGPDKTYTIRKFREVAMWVNIAITRHEDGSPREIDHGPIKEV